MNTNEKCAPRNWWRMAFFIAVVAFEFAREQAVVQANEPTTGNMYSLQGNGELVAAEGEWFRSDAGSPLIHNATSIQCSKETNSCIEATATLMTSGVRTAYNSVSVYKVTRFTNESVEYTDESSLCAIYRVHMDLAQNRVTSTSVRKEGGDPLCSKMEASVPSELSDSIRHRENAGEWMSGHFLPLLRLIRHG